MKTPMDFAGTRGLGKVEWARRVVTGGSAVALMLAAGCAGIGGGEKKAVQEVSPSEFRVGGSERPAVPAEGGTKERVAADAATPAPVPVTQPGAAPAVEKGARVNGGAGGGGGRVVAVVGDPPPVEGAATPVGRDVVADSMVGQIQGRPVYAKEVLDPLEGQLRVASQKATAPGGTGISGWVREVGGLIRRQVERRVYDEVLLGEARGRLTPEERQGLVYFLQRFDQWVSGQSGGSREQAQRDVKERTGDDYDTYLQKQRDQRLIQELIKADVSPNVRVPWRKVERYYADNQLTLNPPPYGVVRILMVDGRNTELVAKAEAAAGGDGEAFRELAVSDANMFGGDDVQTGRKVQNGLVVRTLDKPWEQIEWVGNKDWNKAAATLAVGKTAGPIETGGYKVFIRREADYVSTFRSLEDAQLEVFTALRQTKERQEVNEYVMQLLGRASFTPIDRMTVELLVLAAQRHLPAAAAARVRDDNQLKPDAMPNLERSPAPASSGLDDMSLNPPPPPPSPSTPK